MKSFKEFCNEATKDVETLVVEIQTKIEQLCDEVWEYNKTPAREEILKESEKYSELIEKNLKLLKLKGDK